MTDGDAKTMKMSLWLPEQDRIVLAVVGKLAEEASELAGICTRIMIQGYREDDPNTGKPNLRALIEEIADVQATSEHAINYFGLDRDFIRQRMENKYHHKHRWHEMLKLNAQG